MADDELAEIRRRRMEELRARQAAAQGDAMDQAQAEAAAQQQEAMKENLLRQILTPEARERLTRLRMARPEETRQVENQLISLAQSGRIAQKIDDEQLKALLSRILPGSRDIKISRK